MTDLLFELGPDWLLKLRPYTLYFHFLLLSGRPQWESMPGFCASLKRLCTQTVQLICLHIRDPVGLAKTAAFGLSPQMCFIFLPWWSAVLWQLASVSISPGKQRSCQPLHALPASGTLFLRCGGF